MRCIFVCTTVVLVVLCSLATAGEMERIQVSKDGTGFMLAQSGERFTPWGFNYDHDRGGRLIEDYWDDEWSAVAADFDEMKQLGANVVRVHLQFGRFMQSPDKPYDKSLEKLGDLLDLAERTGLYIDLTGLGCYHKQDVPPWYDKLDEAARWKSQGNFWEAVAGRCKDSPAVFCYDLMNEPVVPGGNKKRDDWLAGAFAGKHFVQFIALETRGRERHEIARKWIEQLTAAIRRHDKRSLVTVGLVPWSLDRPGLTSGFIPEKTTGKLDFLAVHIYPETGKLDEAVETIKAFGGDKPVVIEETFPLKCSPADHARFIDRVKPHAAGLIGFYWGTTIDEYKDSDKLTAALARGWLETFQSRRRFFADR